MLINMQFKDFNELIKKQFDNLTKTGKLFRANVTGDELWDKYLSSFKEGDNPVFRDPESSTHNCNTDKHFIKRYGNIVAISPKNEIMTMFDLQLPIDNIYHQPVQEMSKLLVNAGIKNVFIESFDELHKLPYEKTNKNQEKFQLGIAVNHKQYTAQEVDKFGVVELNKVYQFNHFHVFLPNLSAFVDKSNRSVEAIMGEYRDAKNVFKRAMDEIPVDTLELVQDLITQGSLLNGDAHLYKIKEFLPLKKEYDSLPTSQKDNWAWVKSYGLPFAKFRNEMIGTFCVELAEGVELNKACETWNRRVDPQNYMKAKSPITQNQIAQAKKYIEENGYTESFDRRFATIDDINVEEILHSNVGKAEVKNASIFDNVKPSVSTRHKRSQFDGIEEVTIEKFMKDILPNVSAVELFMENRFQSNLVTMTTAQNKECKQLFKWTNPFSWTYSNNLAGKSFIKESVKERGGEVNGVLRFSIMWAEGDSGDDSDLDAWAEEPNGVKIGFSTSYRRDSANQRTSMSGQLDVDIISPRSFKNKNIVENIVWTDKSKMKDGVYKLWVHMYSNRGSKGFSAEVEVNGEIYTYQFDKSFSDKKHVAEVTLKNGEFSVKHILPETNSSKKLWNVDTNEFQKVNLVCLSPNYWGENNVGNKHYFFMLQDCHSDVPMRSFHVENLTGDLLKDRKVMEVVGETNKLQPSTKQLAGVGFNATVHDEVILKLSGSFKRTIKVKF